MTIPKSHERVWIEIERYDEIDGVRQPLNHLRNHRRADLYSNVIKSLNPHYARQHNVIQWDEKREAYFKWDADGDHLKLINDGYWWNLSYLD